jgi:hypothetical protein
MTEGGVARRSVFKNMIRGGPRRSYELSGKIIEKADGMPRRLVPYEFTFKYESLSFGRRS